MTARLAAYYRAYARLGVPLSPHEQRVVDEHPAPPPTPLERLAACERAAGIATCNTEMETKP
jgi:hypothetical protein